VAERITADVLILAGAEDQFVPVEQMIQFRRALIAARSVTIEVYDRLWHQTLPARRANPLARRFFFDYIAAKFGDERFEMR